MFQAHARTELLYYSYALYPY